MDGSSRPDKGGHRQHLPRAENSGARYLTRRCALPSPAPPPPFPPLCCPRRATALCSVAGALPAAAGLLLGNVPHRITFAFDAVSSYLMLLSTQGEEV